MLPLKKKKKKNAATAHDNEAAQGACSTGAELRFPGTDGDAQWANEQMLL